MRFFAASLIVLPCIIFASEPSVFGAGDLNAPNPYGLTHEEKLILETKKELQTVVQKNNVQNAKVETVTERIDGLQAIIEGLSQKSNENTIALQKINEQLSLESNTSQSINELTKQVTLNAQNIAQFQGLLEELSHTVDGISNNYVSKDEFTTLIKQLKVTMPVSTSVVPVKLDTATLEKDAQKLFSQKKYVEAQSYYETLVQKKYKIAESYFMIGETQYNRQSYKEAIYYYKQSASKDQKGSYMPQLLLHTGVAMEKTGDKANAKAFYQATTAKYSGTDAAKDAAEYLSKLK
ncbi:MAG: hypothetical protein PHO27_08300 [Sulfuricurvum sp.]|nr:hypothetical protein [Sulfuricurvum sp.]